MKQPPLLIVLTCAWLSVGILPACADAPVRVQGVSMISRLFKAAAAQLREEGIEIKIGEDCGNTQALAALANGEIDLALLSRGITNEDRANYPELPLDELKIGTQTIVVLVSRPVWDSGVHALNKEQITKLYEGRTDTWADFGGEKRSTKFFEPAHGHGTWELFAGWLYGDIRKAPAVSWETVADGAEAQNGVQFFSGAASVASSRWADGREVFALAIVDATGVAIEPTPENVESGKYPMSRPAYVVVGDRPAGHRRKVLEFLRSEKGRAVIAGSDLMPLPQGAKANGPTP